MKHKLNFKLKPAVKKKWRNRLIFIGVVSMALLIFFIYINSYTGYDFSHLTVSKDYGEGHEFMPLSGGELPDMALAARNEALELYINTGTADIAVRDLRNNYVWYSGPADMASDPIANPFEHNIMRSHISIQYFNSVNEILSYRSYADAVVDGQAEYEAIPNGLRIIYTMGDMSLGIDAVPTFLTMERFDERVLNNIEEDEDLRFIRRFWFESPTKPGFMQMASNVRDAQTNVNRMIGLFDSIGYTLEELDIDNEAAEIVMDLSRDYFEVTMEFVLDKESLLVNIPLDKIDTAEGNLLNGIDLMRFFGAGGDNEEGFVFVPSGSGGIMRFNNGKTRERPFIAPLYGPDEINNPRRTQIAQPVRMPVLGIAREGAAMLAQIENGSALATVNADTAGRTNSYNTAWFSFSLRSSSRLDMAILEGQNSSLTVVQPDMYTGDITVRYNFLAGEEAGLGGMADVYRQHLIDEGSLTPLTAGGDRSFYLDIIGAVDMERFIFGTPYMSTRTMTNIKDTHRIVDELSMKGINTIQVMLHGWFNRGINHDVAKNINIINDVGSAKEMAALDERLKNAGGGLYPAVNFQLTNYDSRNFNYDFEAAKNPAGYASFMTRFARDVLTTRFSYYKSGWYFLVSPAALPHHIDDFLPAYERKTAFNNLALTDLGDILVESMFRNDGVDREHSRHIVTEQFERLHEQIPGILVNGGNDYSLAYASHLVGVPVYGDEFYILDQTVPFYQMVVHGYIEYAGEAVNLLEDSNVRSALLNSLATGASPRYTWSAEPANALTSTPYAWLYSTLYTNWQDEAGEHYRIFNNIYKDLKTERIVGFNVLLERQANIYGAGQVTETVFSNGTRIFVNNTGELYESGGIVIEPNWFYVEK